MAIEPPANTLFNDIEEEREYRADVRAAMAAVVSRGPKDADEAARIAHLYADALKEYRKGKR